MTFWKLDNVNVESKSMLLMIRATPPNWYHVKMIRLAKVTDVKDRVRMKALDTFSCFAVI